MTNNILVDNYSQSQVSVLCIGSVACAQCPLLLCYPSSNLSIQKGHPDIYPAHLWPRDPQAILTHTKMLPVSHRRLKQQKTLVLMYITK